MVKPDWACALCYGARFRNRKASDAIILVASLGKFGGSSIVARISGISWRQSAALGILMNTRGLDED